jgi:sugar lactone lactonase YvrE
MRSTQRLVLVVAFVLVAPLSTRPTISAQVLPNPYRLVEGWAQLPNGRPMGAVGKVVIDPDGRHVWAIVRCDRLEDPARFGDECRDSKTDPVIRFGPDGKAVKSFGGGMFIWPHGLDVDRDGNVWVTDAVAENRTPKGDKRGQQVVKFSPDGKVLMTLGKPGVAGSGPDEFNAPSAVQVAPNGDIFVADGHGGSTNARIVKFDKGGKFIKAWGKKGSAPGEMDGPHTLAMDSRGRLFLGDRGNNRIQIFDQDGNFIDQWAQFSRPSGVYIDKNDVIYVADSESGSVNKTRGDWKRGIRIGSAKDGKVTAFIPDPNENATTTSAAEGVAADARGNIYGAEVGPKQVVRHVKN